MSSTDNTTSDYRDETSSETRGILGMIRRMAVKLTEGALWQVAGHLLFDSRTPETKNAEVFGTLGFYSRPKPGVNAEVIVVFPGGSSNPVIIGTRDEELRATVAALNQGETAVCNRATIILCKPDGTVEIRTPGGNANKLAFQSEMDNLRAFVMQQFSAPGHTHTLVSGGTVTTGVVPVVLPVIAPSTSYPGTTVLKAQ